MLKFPIKIITLLTIACPGNLIAMIYAYEEDVKLSKNNFLISGALYDGKNKSKGAMTLCFKTVKANFGLIPYEYGHASLVFEMFFPKRPNKVSVCMIHYGGDPHCSGGTNMKPWIESRKSALSRVYRGIRKDPITTEKKHLPAEYISYTSWILSNENLVKGYALANSDEIEHTKKPEIKDSYSCIS